MTWNDQLNFSPDVSSHKLATFPFSEIIVSIPDRAFDLLFEWMCLQLKMAIQTIGAALPQISRYLDRPQSFMPLPSVKTYPSDSFIANIWLNTADQTILVMVANLASKTAAWEVRPPPFIFNSSDPQLQASCLYISHNSHPPQILQSKDRFSLKGSLNPYGFGAWIIHAKSSGDNSTQILPPTQ